MNKVVTLEEVLEVAQQLSLVDKVGLIEKIAPQIERELQVVGTESQPRKSLRGLWRGLDITEEDIAEARQQMWGNFPR
ncbi:MAG: hypothetical protein GDA56_17545 [Hormoscilla sp. GM7CHS1pb]|nr:hypothetical protein [Hormoscilla sp. GM7CHS1pb]